MNIYLCPFMFYYKIEKRLNKAYLKKSQNSLFGI